jgi:hypothetical protein
VTTGPLLAAGGAVLGSALVWAGVRRANRPGRWVGLALLALAAGRLVIWESYPDLLGGTLAAGPVRAIGYMVAIAAAFGAVWVYGNRPAGTRSRTFWALVTGANLLTLWYICFEITAAFDGAHHVRANGHEALMLAAVWGLYGLALAAANRVWPSRPLRYASRALEGAALVLLLLGALMANARWAAPLYRYTSYAAVLGSAWLSELLFERHPEDREVHGLLSLAAAMGGVWVIAFEVGRLLEPYFFLPMEQLLSFEQLAWQKAMTTFWTAAGWGAYGLAVMAAGVWLHSWRARYVAAGVFVVAAGYLLVSGAPNPAAPLWLRLASYALVGGGAVGAAALGCRAAGEQHPREGLVLRLLLWCGIVAAVIWAATEVLM